MLIPANSVIEGALNCEFIQVILDFMNFRMIRQVNKGRKRSVA